MCESEFWICWTSRALMVVLLMITMLILRFEVHKLKKEDNIFKKILNYWSTICFALCSMTSLLLLATTITEIYPIIQPYSMGFQNLTRLQLTFYQTARLQYLFSTKQIIQEYGYHQSVFIFFYFVGALLTLSTFIIILFFLLLINPE